MQFYFVDFSLGEKARSSLEHVKIDPMPISLGSVLTESGRSLQARRTHEIVVVFSGSCRMEGCDFLPNGSA